MPNLEHIRQRLASISQSGNLIGRQQAQQLFDDARDLLVIVDDWKEALELIAGTNGSECSSPRYVAGQALALSATGEQP